MLLCISQEITLEKDLGAFDHIEHESPNLAGEANGGVVDKK
jgi:hypothetical protein